MSSNFCSIQEPLRMLLQWLDANIEAEFTQGYIGLIWIIFLAVIPHMSLSMNCSKKHRDSYCWKLGNSKCFVITESWTSFNARLMWLISLFCSIWTESFNLKKKKSHLLNLKNHILRILFHPSSSESPATCWSQHLTHISNMVKALVEDTNIR